MADRNMPPNDDQKKTPPATILIAKDDEDYKAKIATLEAEVAKLTKAKTAMEDENKDMKAKIAVFEQQKDGNVQNEPATKVQDAKIAKLEARVVEPLIAKMLMAKEISGSTEDELKDEKTRLTAMTLDQIEAEYKGNEKLIAAALATRVEDEEALIAKNEESHLPFNGGQKGLTGKTVSLDSILTEAT